MRIVETLKIILFHVLNILIGSILFILTFQIRLFNNIRTMFYRGVTLLLLISFLMLIVFIILKVFKKFTFISYREIVLNIICCFCLNLLFFTHLPITADRSISVFMLSYMNKNASRSLREEEITNIFIQKYVKENLSTAKRLNEQLEGGTIVKDGNGYKINDRGRLVIQFYNFVADIFHIDKKLISP